LLRNPENRRKDRLFAFGTAEAVPFRSQPYGYGFSVAVCDFS